MLAQVDGYSCGISGSSGGTLAGFQRAARAAGRPVPSFWTGTKGHGRASALRSYTVTVKRLSDGAEVTRTTPPGYHSRDEWRRRCLQLQEELIAELGG